MANAIYNCPYPTEGIWKRLWVGTMMTDWVNDVLFGEIIPPAVEGWLASAATPEWLNGLVLDGIVAGVGHGPATSWKS